MHRAIGMVKGLGVTMDGDMNDDVERASERLRTLYAAIACGVIVLDMTREVVDANAAAQQIVGRIFEKSGARPPRAPRWREPQPRVG